MAETSVEPTSGLLALTSDSLAHVLQLLPPADLCRFTLLRSSPSHQGFPHTLAPRTACAERDRVVRFESHLQCYACLRSSIVSCFSHEEGSRPPPDRHSAT